MKKQLKLIALTVLMATQGCSHFQTNSAAPPVETVKYAAPAPNEPAPVSTPVPAVPKSTERAIVEEKVTVNAKPAPAECLTVTRDLIAYLSRSKPDISEDEAAQKRWLSVSLIGALAHRKEMVAAYSKANPGDKIDYPDNASFIGAWDYPTSYKIAGSRYYGRQAIVDILYIWGKGTEYEGEERLMSFIFRQLDGRCYLDDIYTHESPYSSPESLSEIFSHPSYP